MSSETLHLDSLLEEESPETLHLDPSLEEKSPKQLLALIGKASDDILDSIKGAGAGNIDHKVRPIGRTIVDLSIGLNEIHGTMANVVKRLNEHKWIIASLTPLLKLLLKVLKNPDILGKSAERVFQQEREGLEDDILKKLRASTTVKNKSMEPMSGAWAQRHKTQEVSQLHGIRFSKLF